MQTLSPLVAPAVEPTTHTLRHANLYGELLAWEEVSEPDFAAALHRFYDRAIQRANSVVVVDGILQSRNAFLAFVREFNDCASREARLDARK